LNEVTWGYPIALYLFLAGLSAGGFVFTALFSRVTSGHVELPDQRSAVLLPFLLGAGILMLILDLGRKLDFWKLLFHFNIDSPMSMGLWVLIVFSFLLLFWAIIWLPKAIQSRVPVLAEWILTLRKLNFERIGLWGSALAILVAVYTGVLLSAAATPLWNSVLPLIFLFSSLSTGFALGLLPGLSSTTHDKGGKNIYEDYMMGRYRLLLFGQFVAVCIFLSVAYLTQPHEIIVNLIYGWIGYLWWFGAIGAGIQFPLMTTFFKKKPRWFLAVVIVVELGGAFLLRWSLLIAGQA